jgi:hypothetical protein
MKKSVTWKIDEDVLANVKKQAETLRMPTSTYVNHILSGVQAVDLELLGKVILGQESYESFRAKKATA